MDQGRAYVDTILRLRHRDGDAWHPMVEIEGTHSGPQDIERGWGRGRIFRCRECEIDILVEEEEGGGRA